MEKEKTIFEFLAENSIKRQWLCEKLDLSAPLLWYYEQNYEGDLPEDLKIEAMHHLALMGIDLGKYAKLQIESLQEGQENERE